MDSSSFNNFFQQHLWNSSSGGVGGGGGGSNKGLLPSRDIASSDKNAMSGQSSSSSTSSSSSSSLILAPSKLAQSQPPHSTNRDLSTISLDNRLYLDSGLRHHHQHHHHNNHHQQPQQQQQQQQQARHSFSNGSSMSIGITTASSAGGGGNSRDNNNNGVNAHSMGFASQKLLNRLDIDAIRSNVNRSVGNCNASNGLMHHQHGTILFNTLNGGLNSGGLSDCFNSSDYGHPDSTTPPPNTAISMPPPASSASSSSSTISTNIGLNRSSQDGNPEKVKTPNSIRGELYSLTYFLSLSLPYHHHRYYFIFLICERMLRRKI